MDKREILRVWGKADEFDIELHHIEGELWQCDVPPDTADGVYAVELWATNRNGLTTHWTGELFMCSGICHLRIEERDFSFWISAGRASLETEEETTSITVSKAPAPKTVISFDEGTSFITTEKGCKHK